MCTCYYYTIHYTKYEYSPYVDLVSVNSARAGEECPIPFPPFTRTVNVYVYSEKKNISIYARYDDLIRHKIAVIL